LSGIALLHARDCYSRRENVGGLLARSMVLMYTLQEVGSLGLSLGG